MVGHEKITIHKSSPKQPWRELLQIPIVLAAFGIFYAMYAEKITVATGVIFFFMIVVLSILLSFITIRSYKCPECSLTTKPASGWWLRYPGKKSYFIAQNAILIGILVFVAMKIN